jgi:hypothetical protein
MSKPYTESQIDTTLDAIYAVAEKEGWTIALCIGGDNDNAWEIQRLDDEKIFANDYEAVRFVGGKIMDILEVRTMNSLKYATPSEQEVLNKNIYVQAMRFMWHNSKNEFLRYVNTLEFFDDSEYQRGTKEKLKVVVGW